MKNKPGWKTESGSHGWETIFVKPRHITKGTPDSARSCAIALAIDEKFNIDGWGPDVTGWDDLSYEKLGINDNYEYYCLTLHAEDEELVRDFINDFDNMGKDYDEDGEEDIQNAPEPISFRYKQAFFQAKGQRK